MSAIATRALVASALCVAQTAFADTLLPAVTVTGMSAVEVYTEMKAAVDRARAGLGPTFIEAECYRCRTAQIIMQGGRSQARTQSEAEQWLDAHRCEASA
jgi:pyruvate dehydrogenase E1 component alpha subunit